MSAKVVVILSLESHPQPRNGKTVFNRYRGFLLFVLSGLGFETQCLLESHLQSMLLWLFWRWGLMNYLCGLAFPILAPK
jgi:hypothetical protein